MKKTQRRQRPSSTLAAQKPTQRSVTAKRRATSSSHSSSQALAYSLLKQLNFPDQWVGRRIVPHETDDFSGAVVLTSTGAPFFAVSVQQPGMADCAEESLRKYLLSSRYVSAGISSDGSRAGMKLLRKNAYSSKCEYVGRIEPYAEPKESAIPPPIVATTPTRSAKALTALSGAVESLFFELHSHVRDIDGLHATDALDELCKILFVKLYDERSTKGGSPYRMQRWTYGSSEELASTVRHLYDQAQKHRSTGSKGKMQFDAFSAPIQLSTAALSKVVEALQNYSLLDTPTDIKGRAFQRLIGPATRSEMGQYFTPDQVVDLMVQAVRAQSGESILDPFCGSAHFLTRCSEFAQGPVSLYGIEKSERMVRVATMDAELTGKNELKVRCQDSLLDFSNYQDLQPNSFDVVLTNPPFGSLLSSGALAGLGKFELATGRTAIPLEVLGLERSLHFLRPGGRMAVVLPEGIIANSKTSYIRSWLQREARVRAIVSLPIETFAPFGANLKTCIVFARKWKPGELHGLDYNVAMIRIDDVGYDSTGRVTTNADVQSASTALCRFLAKEGW